MEKELIKIFTKTLEAHFPKKTGIAKSDYIQRFQAVLSKEIKNAPKTETKQGNLSIYVKLSVLILAMIKLYIELGLSENEIGEFIYKAADEYFRTPTIKKWIQKYFFFSRMNAKQIRKRQAISEQLENGINGFKFKFVEGKDKNEYGIDYEKCGICDYFKNMDMFVYVKYCCLVDYAIMKNLGIPFTRTTTLGNGGEKCDFRFSKKGIIQEGWPPTTLREFHQK